VAADVALLLPQASEFAFIVVGLAAYTKIIPLEVSQFVTVVVGLSMLLSPPCALLGRRIAETLRAKDFGHHAPAETGDEFADHVVIGGYGRFGQTLGRLLAAEGIGYVVLDTDGELVSRHHKATKNIYLGDASRPELLKQVGVGRARAFVVTVDSPKAAQRMVIAARNINAEVPVFARALDPEHAVQMLRYGAVGVIPEAVEASLQLGARLLETLGLPEEVIERSIGHAREQELKRMKEQKQEEA
jgi:CPA2 family monovalent cation:H+ antiporter-2